MLPLLAAAGMRYQDLEISFVGSGKDGRLAVNEITLGLAELRLAVTFG